MPRSPHVLDELAMRLKRMAREELASTGTSVTRWRVSQATPLVIEEVEGDLTLEDGDPDFTVGDWLRQFIAQYGLAKDDQVIVAYTGGEWHAFDVASAAVVKAIEGGGGEGSALPTYADLIAADAPISGWDLQDAPGAEPLAATYGSEALSALANVTSGDASNPLYPGAVAIHFSGVAEANDFAATEAAGGLTTYKHMTAEIYVYLPADVGLQGLLFTCGHNNPTYEGMAVWLGDTNAGNNSGSYNSCGILKPGITWNGGSGATHALSSANEAATRCQVGKGWHHFAWRTSQNSTALVELLVDGEVVATIDDPGEGGYSDHTANERAIIGGYGSPGASPNSAEVLFAHAYVYDRRLTNAALRARSDLVALLNA